MNAGSGVVLYPSLIVSPRVEVAGCLQCVRFQMRPRKDVIGSEAVEFGLAMGDSAISAWVAGEL